MSANIINDFVPLGICLKSQFAGDRYASPWSNKVPGAKLIGLIKSTGERITIEGSQIELTHFLASRSRDNFSKSVLYQSMCIGFVDKRQGRYRFTSQSKILSEVAVVNIEASPSDF